MDATGVSFPEAHLHAEAMAELALGGYDDWCHHAGLELIERYGTWARDPYREDTYYAVSVHRARPSSDESA